MNIARSINLIIEMTRLNVLHILEYKINIVFDSAIRFIELAFFFFFWQSIFGANGGIPGWDLTALIVLYAFQNLFLALFITFVSGAYYMEERIIHGNLDKHLSRPVAPWLMVLGEQMFVSFGGWIIGLGTLLFVHFGLGVPIFTPLFPLLLLMIFIGVAITITLGLLLGCLAFWFGRVKVFDRLVEAFWEFDSYPMTIFPSYLQTLSSFILPLLYTATLPALAVIGGISTPTLMEYLVWEIGILVINIAVFSILWNAGVKKYEASGG